jgi:hypothetical protein
MTPLEFADNLAKSEEHKDQVLGAAIVARGLSDDDLAAHRQGWPVHTAAEQAIRYLGLNMTEDMVADVVALMPEVSDAILNKGAAS